MQDCVPADAGDGGLSALQCGPVPADDDGPTEAQYTLYPEGSAADRAFAADVDGRHLRHLTQPSDCSDGPGAGTWSVEDSRNKPVTRGRFACYVDGRGDSVVAWTMTSGGFRAVVHRRGGGRDRLSTLASWWGSHAFGNG